MTIAFVFPGQGAQRAGMGRDLAEISPLAKETFEQADEALGEPLSRIIFEGPEEDLTLTANTQPAILTTSIAALRAFGERRGDIRPTFVAGHSLGEFSALVAASAMDFADAVRTTRARGRFMQEAVPEGRGAMAAVMGKSIDEIRAACTKCAKGEVVSPANFNAPTQIVISGDAAAVERTSSLLRDAGAKVIPLSVSAPFHCALMEPAARKLEQFLSDMRFSSPDPAVVTNVEAAPNTDAGLIPGLLVRQVTSTVRWTESVRYMLDHGITKFIEFGPGNVLAGLIKRTESSAEVISVNSQAGLDKALKALEKH